MTCFSDCTHMRAASTPGAYWLQNVVILHLPKTINLIKVFARGGVLQVHTYLRWHSFAFYNNLSTLNIFRRGRRRHLVHPKSISAFGLHMLLAAWIYHVMASLRASILKFAMTANRAMLVNLECMRAYN